MERDFLGLSINQEIKDVENASVEQRGSEMQWSFSDRNSTSSQVLSFKSYLEEKPKRDISYRVPLPRFLTVSTTDNSSQQSDMKPVYRPQGVRLYAVPNNQNQTTPSSMNYPILQSHTFLPEQNIGGFISNPQSFGCVPAVSPASRIPTPSCFPTYSDTGRTPSRPTQLTIFYAGSVSVYDSVSPEKVQAIMLLAGNETSSTPQSLVSSTKVQAPFTKPSTQDVVCTRSPSRAASTTSGLLSPICTFSGVASHCGGVSNPIAMTSSEQQSEPLKAVNPPRSSVAYTNPGPVPQARKASLARFFEKRRERVTSTQPYSVEQKPSERERNTSIMSDNLSCSLGSLS